MKSKLSWSLAALASVLALAVPSVALAQFGGGPQSPEVRDDRTVTFRLPADKAGNVSVVFGEGAPETHAMTRGADGVWSVTIGPVEPEVYIYHFMVDGLRVLDLANTSLKSGQRLASNVVVVPGTPPAFWERRDVPHGSVNIHQYTSKVQGTTRGLYVYVPDQYYTSDRPLPVLYLYHGGGGMEADWVGDGRAAIILDNLIAAGEAEPMIVVMPNNNAVAPAPPAPAGVGGAFPRWAGLLGEELIDEIIPFIEARYRTIADRRSRAIAGLSAGGGTAFPVGLNNLDRFAYVGEFSSGMFGGVGDRATAVSADEIVPGLFDNVAATAARLTLLYMSCGTEDSRLRFQREVYEDLNRRGFAPVFEEFSGAHEWKVWRHSLRSFAPRLFR